MQHFAQLVTISLDSEKYGYSQLGNRDPFSAERVVLFGSTADAVKVKFLTQNHAFQIWDSGNAAGANQTYLHSAVDPPVTLPRFAYVGIESASEISATFSVFVSGQGA